MPNETTPKMTNAQHRAILAIAGRTWGRAIREDEIAKRLSKPLLELSQSEASQFIDELRDSMSNTPKLSAAPIEQIIQENRERL